MCVFTVSDLAIGWSMHQSHKRGGTTASPIKFNIKENMGQKLVKTLASAMINYTPSERPTIDEVLQELLDIEGKVLLVI